MRQLNLPLQPRNPYETPLSWNEERKIIIKEEIQELSREPLRGWQDYEYQISAIKIRMYLLQRQIEKQALECGYGIEPEVIALNEEYIRLEKSLQWVTEDLAKVQRLAYLRDLLNEENAQ